MACTTAATSRKAKSDHLRKTEKHWPQRHKGTEKIIKEFLIFSTFFILAWCLCASVANLPCSYLICFDLELAIVEIRRHSAF